MHTSCSLVLARVWQSGCGFGLCWMLCKAEYLWFCRRFMLGQAEEAVKVSGAPVEPVVAVRSARAWTETRSGCRSHLEWVV